MYYYKVCLGEVFLNVLNIYVRAELFHYGVRFPKCNKWDRQGQTLTEVSSVDQEKGLCLRPPKVAQVYFMARPKQIIYFPVNRPGLSVYSSTASANPILELPMSNSE